MPEKVIFTADEIRRALSRIAHEIIERNHGCQDLVFIGMLTRGVPLARRIALLIKEFEHVELQTGILNFSLHRDDLSFPQRERISHPSDIPFSIADKHVILVDDVLYTGRSVRSAMDALIDFGRPQQIQLAVLIDRGHRELPIRPDYVGKNMPTSRSEDVEVRLKEIDGRDEVSIRPVTDGSPEKPGSVSKVSSK